MDTLAVRVFRGETVESVHRVDVAVADARGRLVAWFGDPRRVAFLRSSAKPMQLVPLIESGAADRFGFSEEELAVMAGSHSGEDAHVAAVRGILERIGLGEEALQCGRHAPFDKDAADRVGPGFTSIHHNCSGKHSGMLALAVHKGWSTRDYFQREHPVQRAILEAVASECGLPSDAVPLGVDGCSVVNFAVPLKAGARAFARLSDPSRVRGERGRALTRIRDAMVRHPMMVAGTARLDTDVMTTTQGRILVKAGAEACYGSGVVDKGLGILLKVEDGNPRAVGPALVRVWEQVADFSADEAERVAKHWKEPLRNWAGRVVGRVECDLPLRRPRKTAVAQV